MVAHFFFSQAFGAVKYPFTFRACTVKGSYCLYAAQKLDHGAVHFGLCIHKFHSYALLGAYLSEYDKCSYGYYQNNEAGNQRRQLKKYGHNGCYARSYRRSKVHKYKLYEFYGAFQTAVKPSVYISRHMASEIGQGC